MRQLQEHGHGLPRAQLVRERPAHRPLLLVGASDQQHQSELAPRRLLLQVQHFRSSGVPHGRHFDTVGDCVRALSRHCAHVAQKAKSQVGSHRDTRHLGILGVRRHAHIHLSQTIPTRMEEPCRNMASRFFVQRNKQERRYLYVVVVKQF